MSKVLKGIGKIAGIIALIPSPIQPIAAAIAVTASFAAQLTAKKPPVLGSATTIVIGANAPRPYVIGRSYCGGVRVAQEGYGVEDKVPNAHALFVDIYSCGGPVQGLVSTWTDFNQITFTGDNADGYYHNNLHFFWQDGDTPEASALALHWSGAATWGASHKLSGMAAGLWNARWPKKGDIFASGFPQTGVILDGVLDYDPRQDDTYPGGSGSHRWADPSDKAAFAAAKATWDYGDACPGRAGLRYALGTWERNESDTDAPYIHSFGMGLPWDGVVVEDFVQLANVCDANNWKCNGVIWEPGDPWANLKRIVAAGGAEPVWKGSRLGLKISAPGVALATIGHDDLAGEISAAAMQSYRDRPNTLISKTRDPGQKWEYAATATVSVEEWVTADGEERRDEVQWDMVTDPTQGAALTRYQLGDGREQGPIELPLKSAWRSALAGERYALTEALAADLALETTDVMVVDRRFDPEAMIALLTLVTDTPSKHTDALGSEGEAPPPVVIVPPEDIDGTLVNQPAIVSAVIRGAYFTVATGLTLLTGEDASGSGKITVADHAWQYPNGAEPVAREGDEITGLALSTAYHVYFDDETLAEDEPTYFATTDAAVAINSADNPWRHYLGSVTTPGSGGGATGGGGGFGYPGLDTPPNVDP